MTPISISNCPITGLNRKVTNYDFLWSTKDKKIVIRCMVSHFNEADELIENSRILSYVRDLVASDSKVNPETGALLTIEELQDEIIAYEAISEYDYYVSVVGSSAIILPQLLQGIIQLRDSEGKFNV
jgi:hypothetical protein